MTTRKVYRFKKPSGDYKCNKCNRKFKEARFLKKHLNRTTPCDKIFKCEKCYKTFKEERFLNNHRNRKAPCIPESVPIVTNDNAENKCHMCGKTYANVYNLKRHQKNCSIATNPQAMQQLMSMVSDLKQEVRELRQTQPIVNNNTLNHINVQNNNLYLNVTICSFGNEDLSKLDTAKIMQLLKNHADNFMPKMIEHVHANPDHPEFHNVFYDPRREKAIVFVPISDTEMSWQARDFQEVSTDLTEKIKQHIHPGAGPYFDQAARVKDYDTSNKIIQIVDASNWSAEDIKESLSKVQNNRGFMELVQLN